LQVSVCVFAKTAGERGFVFRELFREMQWTRRWNMLFSVSGGNDGVRWELDESDRDEEWKVSGTERESEVI